MVSVVNETVSSVNAVFYKSSLISCASPWGHETMDGRAGIFISSYWKAAGRDTPFISAVSGVGVHHFPFTAI